MIVFHGTGNPVFEVHPRFLSRYGFYALFCTDNLDIAKKYAVYYAFLNDKYKKINRIFAAVVWVSARPHLMLTVS